VVRWMSPDNEAAEATLKTQAPDLQVVRQSDRQTVLKQHYTLAEQSAGCIRKTITRISAQRGESCYLPAEAPFSAPSSDERLLDSSSSHPAASSPSLLFNDFIALWGLQILYTQVPSNLL
jgi:hypothetical protein